MSNQSISGQYDVLIRGGQVVEPGTGQSGKRDVAVKDGKIAAVAESIDASMAKEVIDAGGQYVTPGLVDLHTHVYWGSTFWGIEPDPVAARSGCTTWLDVGSSGAYSFPGLRRHVVETAKAKIFVLLNLSSIGLIGPSWEFANPDYWDLELAQTIIEANRDVVIGIKARIDSSTTRGVGIAPLAKARELADLVDLPLMTHIGSGPPSIREVIPHLRPGDILTHCFTGGDMRIIDEHGKILPEIRDLREAGLILDIGHGTGSFSFETTEKMLEQGYLPDVISTDIHQMAIQGPAFDMPTTMSKFLALGMSLEEVIERSTAKPAAAMRRTDCGSLAVGQAADIAVFRIEEGDFTFQDVRMNERKGSQLLRNTATFIDGELLERVPLPKLQPWAVLPQHQRGRVNPITEIPAKDPAPLLDNR
ncbi:MAG: amidohydrolase/deacetylase family metallohydrolase [Thermomicrobiales bacterium]